MHGTLPNRDIICIDMKSFYASCMALLHDLDVMTTPIAVVGNFKQPGSVVLASSPWMKKRFGIKTGNRLYEIPKHPSIRLFEPRMSFFLEISMAITKLISSYVPSEAIHVYSIDESFVDLTGTDTLWGHTEETARAIQRAIYQQFRMPSAIGMGPNMLVAKLALDLEAKKAGFARWSYEDIPNKLWPVHPLSEMWGIGRRMEQKLNSLGIYSVGDLANSELAMLEKQFGVMGNQLYYHAHGIDFSTFGGSEQNRQQNQRRLSYGMGQMLMRDYTTKRDIQTVILEMCEDIAKKIRKKGFSARTVSLGLSYSRQAITTTKGFYHSKSLDRATNDTMELYRTCLQIFEEYFEKEPARQIAIRFSNLEVEYGVQLSLFDEGKLKRSVLAHTMDEIRTRFGSTALLRASSYTRGGTAIQRSQLVGGHLG